MTCSHYHWPTGEPCKLGDEHEGVHHTVSADGLPVWWETGDEHDAKEDG